MAVAAIPPPPPAAGSLERNLALIPGGGGGQPHQEDPGRSTPLITAVPASRPATGADHPQHRRRRLRECQCPPKSKGLPARLA